MILTGVGASPGLARGPAWLHRPAEISLPDEPAADPDAELAALRGALREVAADLEREALDLESEARDIVRAQALMACDPELELAARKLIESQSASAARAVIDAGERYARAIESSDSEYLAARASDVRHVCARVARRVLNLADSDPSAIDHPAIIVADDLAPVDTARLEPSSVRGLVLQQGSRTSHTAILARALGIPAVVAVAGALDAIADGAEIAIDGDSGAITVAATDEESAAFDALAAEHAQRLATSSTAEGPSATADGHRIEVAANAGSPAEVAAAVAAGAEGVGLFRTELAYLDRSAAPSEDEQAELLIEAARLLDGRRLVVRTFDFGADKPARFMPGPSSLNPALGVRGLQLAREHPEVFDAQLRAVVRAAAAGPIAVMAPMVAGIEDAEWFIAQVEAAGGRDAGVQIGVMVEIPSAVLVADGLARRLDFLSIGTNDLSQYLHAADRQEGDMAHLQDPFSPALLRAVSHVCAAGSSGGAWVGVCGEAAGDPLWAPVAVGLGVAELSMGAGSIPRVRAALAAHDLANLTRVAQLARDASTTAEARAIAEKLR